MRCTLTVVNNYVERDVQSVLLGLVRQFPVVAITGPRQSGKSTLLRHIFPDLRYITLDDPLLRTQALDDPELLLGGSAPLVIDEIQYVPSLLSHLKMRVDRARGRRGAFVLTGSQQFILMKHLGESLAGRIGLLELLPFSLSELWRAGQAKAPTQTFVDACLRGSFPEPVLEPSMDASRWYGAYIQTYLERDIRTLHDIGHLREFERFLQLLAARCSQELNLSSLAGDVGVAVNTIKKWVSILEACRIIFLLPPYYRNLGKRVIKAPKVYFLDCGLVCYLTGIRSESHLLQGPMGGALFENLCVQEAVKTFFSKGALPRLFYLRTQRGLEVDLLVESVQGRLYPFECKMARTPRPSMADSLTQFHDEFGALDPMPGAVVSLTDQTQPLTRNTQSLTIQDFVENLPAIALP